MLEKIRKLAKEHGKEIAYYGALALLLGALALASHGYRTKRVHEEQDAMHKAVSVQAPLSTAAPEPTPEPIRWAWPLAGEVVGEYAPDAPVWSGTLMQWQTHPALDIAGSPGEAVYACREGVVADAYSDRLWGNVIVVDHGDGWRSTYRGLNTLKLVQIGQSVAAGDVISAVGPSVPCEAELGAHLHFELTRDGMPADFEQLTANPD